MLNYTLITKNERLFIGGESSDISKVIDFISNNDKISLSVYSSKKGIHEAIPLCIAISNLEYQYIIDLSSFSISELVDVLNKYNGLIIGFDIKESVRILYHYNITFRNCKLWDVGISEFYLTNGLESSYPTIRSMGNKYSDVAIIKDAPSSIIASIPNLGFTEPVVEYCASIGYIVSLIYPHQIEASNKLKMDGFINLTNESIKAIAYIEYCGINVDTKLLSEASTKNLFKSGVEKEFLIKAIKRSGKEQYLDNQLSLFDDVPNVAVNFDDPNEMKKVLVDIGGLEYADYTGESEDGSFAELLRGTTRSCNISNSYNNYIRNKIKASEYGSKLISCVNNSTSRVHPKIIIQSKTGRIKCKSGVGYANTMGVDKSDDIRKCFKAIEGSSIISYDFVSMASTIIKNVYDELQTRDATRYGDEYCGVARTVFKDVEMITDDVIISNYPQYRNAAKRIKLLMLNGGDAMTIARSFGVSSTQANKVYKAYVEEYGDAGMFISKATITAIYNTHISLDDGTLGGIWNIPDGKSMLALARKHELLAKGFWEYYKNEREMATDKYQELKEVVAKYQSWKKEIRRKATSYLTQGIESNILKLSLIYIYNDIVDSNAFGVVKIVNAINDNIVLESPNELCEEFDSSLQHNMLKASELYKTKFDFQVSGGISDYWGH